MSVRVVATTPLAVPVERVDLAAWVLSLSDDDYRATSRAHLGFGQTAHGGGRGVTAVEALGGAFVINHHVVEHAEARAFRLRSRTSRAYLLRLVPVRLDLTWELSATSEGRLECALTVTLPLPLDRLAEPIVSRLLQRHADEETPGFAADLARKQGAAGNG